MSRFWPFLQIFAALSGLIVASGGNAFGAAAIERGAASPPAPEASAPLPPPQSISQPAPPEAEAWAPIPPRQTTFEPPAAEAESPSGLPSPFQPPPREARPGTRSQESALSPRGSSRPATTGRRLPRPAPQRSALAKRASTFINTYWEQSSASGDEALRYLSSVYAPVVQYYGQPRTRSSVLQDKQAFLRRWPIRQTWPASQTGKPTISCARAMAECEITGLRDFAATSPGRGARAAGVVRYSYTVRFMDGMAQIVAESSRVVGSGAIAVSSPAALAPLW